MRLALVCILCFLLATVAMARQENPSQPPVNPQANDNATETDKAVTDDSDIEESGIGPSLRRIYFYESQAPKLVPSNYYQVTVEELDDALKKREVPSESVELRPYLASSVYIAKYQRGALISDASTFDIIYRDNKPTELVLGPVNLALESQANGSGRRLVTGSDGILRAIVDQDSRLRFAWSRRATQMPEGRLEFDLRIPACGRTRFIIGMPKGTELEARDGVLSSLPSPPPEVQAAYGETELSWYAIEAGGLSRVRLSVVDQTESRLIDSKYILRSLNTDGTLNLRGLDWTTRLVVDIPRGADLPTLTIVRGGRITGVRIDNTPVRWQESNSKIDAVDGVQADQADAAKNPPNQNDLEPEIDSDVILSSVPSIAINILDEQIEDSSENSRSLNATNLTRVIEISGTVSWEDLNPIPTVEEDAQQSTLAQLRMAIPWVRMPQLRTSSATSEAEILLSIGGGLSLAEITRQFDWRCDQLVSDEGSPIEQRSGVTKKYRFSGSPSAHPPIVRCSNAQIVGQSVSAFRLAVVDEGMKANWEAAIQAREQGPQPIQFSLQPGWQVDSISIRSSGRVVDLRDGGTADFAIWPEPGDIVDGVLRLQITGTQTIAELGNTDIIPKSWFVRQTDSMMKCYAAVVPPPEYEWVAGTALEGKIIDSSDLPSLAAEMLGPIAGETLVFDATNGETPELMIAQPPAAFNAEMFLHLSLEDDLLVERVRIDFKVPAGRIPSVQVQLGTSAVEDSDVRQQMRWSVLANDLANVRFPRMGSMGTQSQETLIANLLNTEEATNSAGISSVQETWELAPSGGIRDGLSLYGERRYAVPSIDSSVNVLAEDEVSKPSLVDASSRTDAPLKNAVYLPLPSLPLTPSPQGSNHRATLTLGPRIDLINTSGEVLRIPRAASDSTDSSESLTPEISVSKSDDSPEPITWTLRYNPMEPAGITIRPHPDRDAPAVIWEQNVEILAGNAGDEISASFRVEGGAAITLQFDSKLQVTKITGREIPAESPQPGMLNVAPNPGDTTVQVIFWRPHTDTSLLRLLTPPEILVSGVVMRSTTKLWPAADTIALTSGILVDAPDWMSGDARGTMTTVDANIPIWLIPGGLAWALASAIALTVFALGWLVSRRFAGITVLSVVAICVIALIIPVWTQPILGFIVIPLTTAGLFTSALNRRDNGSNRDDGETDQDFPGRIGTPVDTLAPTATHKPELGDIPGLASEKHQGAETVTAEFEAKNDQATNNANEANKQGDEAQGNHGGDARRINPWIGFFAFLFALSFTSFQTGLAKSPQDNSSAESTDRPASVLIPVDEDGNLVGNRVYVPKSLYDLVYRPRSIEEQLGRIDFQSADYNVRISSSGMRDVGDSVSVDAVWRVEIDSASQLVRLPIDPTTLDRLEIVVDSVPNEIRPEPDGQSVLVRMPKSGVNVIRANLAPEVKSAVAGSGKIDLPIPAVANSSITITPDSLLDQISLPGCKGQINRFESGTRVSASLGPVNRLEIIWQQRGTIAEKTTSSVKRRWWVHAGQNHLSRELELDIGSGIGSGVVVELNTDVVSAPQLTTREWAMVTNENTELNRGRLRVVATTDSPGPIRLIWTDNIVKTIDSSIVLPNVRPTNYAGPIETWVAIDVPRDWRVSAIETATATKPSDGRGESSRADGSIEEVSSLATNETEVDSDKADELSLNSFEAMEQNEFITNWSGYRGAIDFVRRHPDAGAVNIRLAAPKFDTWSANVTHEVVVRSSHLDVQCLAIVTPRSASFNPIAVRLPANFRIESLSINGKSHTATVQWPSSTEMTGESYNDGAEVMLPQLQSNTTSEILITGTIGLSKDKRFSIPRLMFEGLNVVNDQYLMSRTDGLRVRELKEPDSVVAGDLVVEYDLMAGTVPLRSWRFTDNDDVSRNSNSSSDGEFNDLRAGSWDGGRFRVTEVSERFAAKTLTSLRWNDGVWTMDVSVEVDNFAGLSDFLTLRIPSRWIDGLDVRPAVKWSSQPSTDGESHLVRVLPITSAVDRMVASSKTQDGTGRRLQLNLSSRLENASEGGVSVPQILLLGGGQRKNFFALPKRLTTSPIVWRVQNARVESLDGPLKELAPTDETHTIYEAVGDQYSATLQPAPVGDDSARCPIIEVSLFPQDKAPQKAIGLLRAFFLPGNRDELLFHIPNGTSVIGTWAAGMPVGFDRVSEEQVEELRRISDQSKKGETFKIPQSGSVIKVPLAYSRLADQVVVLYRFDMSSEDKEIQLPVLLDIPVGVTWICRYQRLPAELANMVDERYDAREKDSPSWLSSFFASTQSWIVAGSSESESMGEKDVSDQSIQEYQNDLTTAITDLLDASVDSAAERPVAEKREWLRPWFVRLRALGWSPSNPVQLTPDKDAQVGNVDSQDAGENSSQARLSAQVLNGMAQEKLDNWAPRFFQQVLGSESSGKGLGNSQSPGTWMSPPAGWQASNVTRFADDQNQPLVAIPYNLVQGEHKVGSTISMRSGRLAKVLGVVAVILALGFLASKFKWSPAMWLLILGVLSIGLTPLPISFAMIGLALFGPILPRPAATR